MLLRWLNVIIFTCFGVLTLMVIAMTRRPLCIESKVVERIDRVVTQSSTSDVDTVYRCSFNKATPFSQFFNNHVKDLGMRIQRTERWLESLEPFQRRVQIVIVKEQPNFYQVEGHRIFIGESLMSAPGHLEKAFAKIWYRERRDAFFINEPLMEEVLTDFLLFLQEGDVDLGDPKTHLKTALAQAKWPYVLKSTAEYCESPWKISEHYESCQGEEKEKLSSEVIELSLRPLIASSWISAYRSLSLNEQISFAKSLPRLLREDHSPDLPAVQNAKSLAEVTPLLSGAEAIKNINLFVSTSSLLKNSEAHRLFVAAISQELRRHGFQDAFAEASFDLLFVSASPLKEDSAMMKHFMKLAKDKPDVHIALRDRDNIWMLPSKFPIPMKSFGQLRANRAVVEKCGGFDFNYVMAYAHFTEKLLVVENCDQKKELQFGRYLKDGAEGFGAQNKTISFIQFHLPSLMLKREELSQVANVFDLIRNREVDTRVFQSLGWQEIKWSEQASAYHPKAFIDAIEWFRTN